MPSKRSPHQVYIAMFEDSPRSQSYTSLIADFPQDINRVFSFSRCLNGIFDIGALTQMRRVTNKY